MKKIYTSLSIIIFSIGLMNAQITLTTSVIPAEGDIFTSQGVDTTALNGNGTGANQAWDFSNLKTLSTTYTQTFVKTSLTTYASDYPSATIANDYKRSDKAVDYYKTDNNTITFLGYENQGGNSKYTDTQVLFTFPFTYNTSQNDNFSGTGANGSLTSTRTGNVTTLGDAYGTITVPGGITYTNVLRVKQIITEVEQVQLGGVPSFNYSTTKYMWYSANYKVPVFTYVYYVQSATNYPTVRIKSAFLYPAQAVGIEKNQEAAINNLFPNPSLGVSDFTFTLSNGGETSVSITDALGQSVRTISKGNLSAGIYTEQIKTEGLSKGIYFIILRSGNYSSVGKLMVQ